MANSSGVLMLPSLYKRAHGYCAAQVVDRLADELAKDRSESEYNRLVRSEESFELPVC